jgi:16S rRNA processing protein RimM
MTFTLFPDMLAGSLRVPLPTATAADELYQADLIGLPVFLASGEAVGRVVSIPNYDAMPGRLQTVLVPFVGSLVPSVDTEAGRIVIDLPEGLLGEPERVGRP